MMLQCWWKPAENGRLSSCLAKPTLHHSDPIKLQLRWDPSHPSKCGAIRDLEKRDRTHIQTYFMSGFKLKDHSLMVECCSDNNYEQLSRKTSTVWHTSVYHYGILVNKLDNNSVGELRTTWYDLQHQLQTDDKMFSVLLQAFKQTITPHKQQFPKPVWQIKGSETYTMINFKYTPYIKTSEFAQVCCSSQVMKW